MIAVVIEGVVEGIKLFEGDHGEQGVPQQCQVFGSLRVSFRPPVLPPVGGVPFPMVEVFHTPVITGHCADLGGCFAAVFMGGAKQTDRHFGLGSFFRRAVDARAFDDLGDVGKRADLGVHGGDGNVPDLESAMAAFEFPRQIHGAAVEQLLGVFVVVSLVLLDGGKVITAEFKDYAIRFFWVCRASEVMVAFSSMAPLCLRSSCATGSSQSSFSPL